MSGFGDTTTNKLVVSLLDYGAGNVRSVRNAIAACGYLVKDIVTPEDIDAADVIVFPGVGSFGSAMDTLNGKNFTAALKTYILADRPFFGICLGMQTLFEGSEESEGHAGLGIIPGLVKAFDATQVTSPHIGWNGLVQQKDYPVTSCLLPSDMVYFVHSYRALPTDQNKDWVLATCTYGEPEHPQFIAAVQRGNVVATQFHPEKSGQVGLKLLAAFLQRGKEGVKSLTSSSSPAAAGGAGGEGERGAAADIASAIAMKHTKLAKRIVACLDVRTNDAGDLVVTKGDQYDVRESVENGTGTARGGVRNLGKPVELAGRYYDEGADEICFLNITSFREGVLEDAPMLQVLERASEKVFVPLTVGGGIRGYTASDGTVYSALEVAARYFRAGADKVSLGSDAVYAAEALGDSGRGGGNAAALDGSSSIEQISRRYGRQAVVISVDPRRVYVKVPSEADPKHTVLHIPRYPGPNGEEYAWYQVTVKGGREGRDMDAVELARRCERLGAGEILLNCVDMDGQKKGFDLELVKAVMGAVTIPVIASSGAGAPEHFSEVFNATDVQAALAAGIFHRKEVEIKEVKAHLVQKNILTRTAA